MNKAFSAKRKQEHDEFLEQLEFLTSNLRDYRDAMGEFIIDYDDIETYQEVAEKITTILLMASIADNDKNAVLRVTDSFDDNCEQMLEMTKPWKMNGMIEVVLSGRKINWGFLTQYMIF